MKDQTGSKPKKSRQSRTSIRSMKEDLRQCAYPKEFRIAAGARSITRKQVDEIMKHMQSQPQPKDDGSQLSEELVRSMDAQRTETEKIVRLLADVGTGLWRLRKRMVHEKTGEPLEEMRKAYRHLESIWDALRSAEIVIKEYAPGSTYDSGFALNVLAFQPMAGLGRETIIETVKPTITYKGGRIQKGEVIVGTPETSHKTEKGKDDAE